MHTYMYNRGVSVPAIVLFSHVGQRCSSNHECPLQMYRMHQVCGEERQNMTYMDWDWDVRIPLPQSFSVIFRKLRSLRILVYAV